MATDYQAIFDKAHLAGQKAANAVTPTPIVVSDHHSGQQYYVPQGICGFAWINVPGNTGFGRWLKTHGGRKDSYEGGVTFWVHDYNQSYDLKCAYAGAFAGSLRESGINKVHAGSRLD